ncbi:MAG: hypothetical protein WA803_09645, partial [Steroidobacteraceae bacterium]
ASIDGRELFRKDGLAAWRAKSAVGQAIYVAVFNLRETPAPVTIKLEELGVKGVARVRDLWRRSDLEPVQDEFVPLIPRHGAGLFRLSAT